MNIRQLSRQESQYSYIEFCLRLSLQSVSANVLRIFAIERLTSKQVLNMGEQSNNPNPVVDLSFISLFQNDELSNCVDFWVNCESQLPKQGRNSLDRIIETGKFEFSNKSKSGMKIHVGNIRKEVLQIDNKIEPTSLPPSLQKLEESDKKTSDKKVYTLLLCKANVGKYFCCEESNNFAVLPEGYDSIYLLPQQQENQLEEANFFCHKYIIFDDKRILPQYIVCMEFDPMGDAELKNPQQFTSLNLLPKQYESIIHTAYNQAIHSLFDTSSLPSTTNNEDFEKEKDHLQSITNTLKLIEERREEIFQNSSNVENQLKSLFKQSLVQLYDITQLKLSALLSMEVDLRRRAEELEYMNSFMKYQKQFNTPVSFLDAFSQFCAMKKSKLQQMDDPLDDVNQYLQKILPDMTVAMDSKLIHCDFAQRVNSELSKSVNLSGDCLLEDVRNDLTLQQDRLPVRESELEQNISVLKRKEKDCTVQ